MKLRRELLITLMCFIMMHGCGCCRGADSRRAISYSLIKSNAKSTTSIISRKRVANLAKCKDFAEAKQALAFNFDTLIENDYWKPNCILLHCPETTGLSQLINISGTDYYSTFANITYADNTNLNCIEKTGLFMVFSERQNFTNARNSCCNVKGVLAEVTTEIRTRALASLVGNNLAFVGLSNEGNDRTWKNEFGELLSCFDYRAWDSGEPSHSRGCVGLIQTEHKSNPVWKVIPCRLELPYICEIFRSGNKEKD